MTKEVDALMALVGQYGGASFDGGAYYMANEYANCDRRRADAAVALEAIRTAALSLSQPPRETLVQAMEAPTPLSFPVLMEMAWRTGVGVEAYGGAIAAGLERFARAIEAAHSIPIHKELEGESKGGGTDGVSPTAPSYDRLGHIEKPNAPKPYASGVEETL